MCLGNCKQTNPTQPKPHQTKSPFSSFTRLLDYNKYSLFSGLIWKLLNERESRVRRQKLPHTHSREEENSPVITTHKKKQPSPARCFGNERRARPYLILNVAGLLDGIINSSKCIQPCSSRSFIHLINISEGIYSKIIFKTTQSPILLFF